MILQRECGVRSLPGASTNSHCLESKPRPLIIVIGSDAFTNYTIHPYSVIPKPYLSR